MTTNNSLRSMRLETVVEEIESSETGLRLTVRLVGRKIREIRKTSKLQKDESRKLLNLKKEVVNLEFAECFLEKSTSEKKMELEELAIEIRRVSSVLATLRVKRTTQEAELEELQLNRFKLKTYLKCLYKKRNEMLKKLPVANTDSTRRRKR